MSDEDEKDSGAPDSENEFAELTEDELAGEDLGEDLGDALADAAIADAVVEDADRDNEAPDLFAAATTRATTRAPSRGARNGTRPSFGEWTGIDRILVVVLVANILLMAALVFLPGKSAPAEVAPPVRGPRPTEPPAKPPQQAQRTGRALVVPRHELWDLAWEQATNGELDKAIATLHELLETNKSMTKVVRRTVYLNLAQLYGRAGKLDESDHYFNLANSDFVTGLIPGDLWKLAEESFAAGGWAGARRYAARFLLQKKQMPKDLEKLIPLAYLRLADGYRNESRGASTTRGGPKPAEARK